jgi:hypothetical protein
VRNSSRYEYVSCRVRTDRSRSNESPKSRRVDVLTRLQSCFPSDLAVFTLVGCPGCGNSILLILLLPKSTPWSATRASWSYFRARHHQGLGRRGGLGSWQGLFIKRGTGYWQRLRNWSRLIYGRLPCRQCSEHSCTIRCSKAGRVLYT